MFVISERPDGKFMIGLSAAIPLLNGGSLNILPARLLNLTYPDYLRLCRDAYGADLYGREGYSYPVFKTKPTQLISLLKSIAAKVPQDIWEKFKEAKSYPDERYMLPNGIKVRVRV